MKKFTFAAVAAVSAVMMFACGNGAPKANLKSDVDTVSYAIGMAQTQGLKDYLVGRLGVDTTYMDEFIKGLNEGEGCLLCWYSDWSADQQSDGKGYQPRAVW